MDLFENANNKKDPNKISGTNIDNLPLFLTVEELATVLRIRKNTAYKFVKKVSIRSIHVRNLIRIPRDALLEFY